MNDKTEKDKKVEVIKSISISKHLITSTSYKKNLSGQNYGTCLTVLFLKVQTLPLPGEPQAWKMYEHIRCP